MAPRYWLCQRLHRPARRVTFIGCTTALDAWSTRRVRRASRAPWQRASSSSGRGARARRPRPRRRRRGGPRRPASCAWASIAGEAHAAAVAPRAGDRARRAAEVGDHLAAAAAGHTLPRRMGRLGLILAVVALACHERDETSVPRMRRPGRGSASGRVVAADHGRRGGAAPARTSARSRRTRSTTRPCAAWRCRWHNFFFGAFEPGRQRLDRQAAGRPVAAGREREAARLQLDDAEAAGGVRGHRRRCRCCSRPCGGCGARRPGSPRRLAMAVLPVEVITARSDTMDGVMMALIVLALLLDRARASRRGRTRVAARGRGRARHRVQRQAARVARRAAGARACSPISACPAPAAGACCRLALAGRRVRRRSRCRG